jgi:hypothetical protein
MEKSGGSAALGAGLGIGLAVLLLIAVAVAIIGTRSRRKQAKPDAPDDASKGRIFVQPLDHGAIDHNGISLGMGDANHKPAADSGRIYVTPVDTGSSAGIEGADGRVAFSPEGTGRPDMDRHARAARANRAKGMLNNMGGDQRSHETTDFGAHTSSVPPGPLGQSRPNNELLQSRNGQARMSRTLFGPVDLANENDPSRPFHPFENAPDHVGGPREEHDWQSKTKRTLRNFLGIGHSESLSKLQLERDDLSVNPVATAKLMNKQQNRANQAYY